ncbi:MAG: site-specific DNA-methyltransferase [Candidatus Anstonellaceae archaeon]
MEQNSESYEKKFYQALQDVFIGAKIEGKGGFINLMKIKSNYYKKIEKLLKDDIEKALEKYPSFRDELFDKLYDFFNKYFTESGSIYFNSTPFHNNIYEKVYTDDKDVILFWKTHMLYYVKTDRIFRSLPVEFDNLKFYFDATEIENKKANEKRSLIYELKEIKEDKTIVFRVIYSEKGRITKTEDILKELKKKQLNITEEQLERAFRTFEKQSEVDFFINKNAKAFLQEQFKLWSYQYFWDGAKEWTADRINQLQILKDIAFKIIDFISQFEDELVKIWNKPKFVKNSNYVISLKTLKSILPNKDYEFYLDLVKKKLLESVEYQQDIKNTISEVYRDNVAGIFVKNVQFNQNSISISYQKRKKQGNGYVNLVGDDTNRPKLISYESIYIDTKYFDEKFKLQLLGSISRNNSLDQLLDGLLIKSESWQVLNSLKEKYKNQIDLIYIDPPFNTQESGFLYEDKFLDSSWLSLMNDRIKDSLIFLKRGGNFCLHLDENADYYGRLLLDSNGLVFQRELIWNVTAVAYSEKKKKWIRSHDVILYASNEDDPLIFNPIRLNNNEWDVKKMGSILGGKGDDIITTKYTHFNRNENIQDFSTQKTESLLARIIKVLSNKGGIVFDYFAGTGTTLAAAHKLGRKWIGVEMAEYFESITLPRMKKVIWGDRYGISPDVNWQGGGFFKYYELEQYEEALANCKYEDGDPFIKIGENPYEEYVFMKDEKMLRALEIDYKNNKVKVDLSKLYPNIDIAETLSNLTGKWIKKISKDEVEFEDGTKINIKDLDYKLIKPLIWWE